MAAVGAAENILEVELSCPVCLTTYRDPVSLGCGHCFCRQCITEALSHQKAHGRPYTCPMCQAHYQDFPPLLKNLQLSSIVESYASMQKTTDECQIPCGDCLDQPNLAVKTCASCEVSLCQKHLERHITKNHILLELTASVQERKCSEHDKLLEYYCERDNCCICVTCYIAGSHKSHNIVTLKQAHEKQLATLSAATATLSANVSAFCKDIKDLNAGLTTITANTLKLSKPLEDLCDKIISLVSNQFKEIVRTITARQEETTSKITAIIKQLEDARATTEKVLNELNLMSKQADDLLFIKDFNRSQKKINHQSPNINILQVVDVEADKTMLENVNKETNDYIENISQQLKYIDNVLSQQIEQLVWSGRQRKKVQNQKKVLQSRSQKSEKMNLNFKGVNCTHCSYSVIASNHSKMLTATIPKFDQFVKQTAHKPPWPYKYAPYSTPQCICKLPLVIPDCITRKTSSSKVHCLVDVSMSNDWCVGVTNIEEDNISFLRWDGKDLSYESDSSLSLGSTKLNRLKMQLDFDTNLLGFYDAGHATEIPILICKCDDVFADSIKVGVNVLDGSLSLI